MSSGRRYVCSVLLALLSGLMLAWAADVSVDWDKSVDFSKYRSYAWVAGTNAKNPLVHERLLTAINGQLEAKGLTRVDDPAKADMLVLYHASTDYETRLNTTSMNNGWGVRWGDTGTSTTTVSKIPMGQLVVDLVDAGTRKLVWLGSASDSISDKPEKNEQKINKAVKKLFEKFPPKPKKS